MGRELVLNAVIVRMQLRCQNMSLSVTFFGCFSSDSPDFVACGLQFLWETLPQSFYPLLSILFCDKSEHQGKKRRGGGESKGVYSDTAVSTKVVQKKRESVCHNAKR